MGVISIISNSDPEYSSVNITGGVVNTILQGSSNYAIAVTEVGSGNMSQVYVSAAESAFGTSDAIPVSLYNSDIDRLTISAAGNTIISSNNSFAVTDNLTDTLQVEGSIGTDSTVSVLNASSATAGGVSTPAMLMGTSGIAGIYFGSGAPTISAGKGSLFIRTDGTTTNDRAYINTDGSTTWTALITAA